MLLSIQQRFILDTLKKLNCVRRRQLHALVRGRFQQDGFETTQARMDALTLGGEPASISTEKAAPPTEPGAGEDTPPRQS